MDDFQVFKFPKISAKFSSKNGFPKTIGETLSFRWKFFQCSKKLVCKFRCSWIQMQKDFLGLSLLKVLIHMTLRVQTKSGLGPSLHPYIKTPKKPRDFRVSEFNTHWEGSILSHSILHSLKNLTLRPLNKKPPSQKRNETIVFQLSILRGLRGYLRFISPSDPSALETSKSDPSCAPTWLLA